jgi:hypothetical protein
VGAVLAGGALKAPPALSSPESRRARAGRDDTRREDLAAEDEEICVCDCECPPPLLGSARSRTVLLHAALVISPGTGERVSCRVSALVAGSMRVLIHAPMELQFQFLRVVAAPSKRPDWW